MKRSLIFILVGALIVVLIVTSLQKSSPEDYIASIQKEREEKEIFMKSGDDSPFQSDSNYSGLKYFPIDETYRIKAKLESIEKKKARILQTSDGIEQRYLEYAYALFQLNGVENKLLILEIMDAGPQKGKLFLAFADETSGNETYGAGRYLDVKKVPNASSILLDFNLAYNPYCAYKDHYSCPLPPLENLLKVAIRAGEKSYHE
jgi:uncharacterized protein (DUF1684 family)